MGGIAIVVARARRRTSSRTSAPSRLKFARAGHHADGADRRAWRSSASSTTTWACAAARNLGLRKRGKTGGELIVAGGFALLALQVRRTSRRTCRSPACSTSTSAPACGSWSRSLWSTAARTAVNFTDGLDGLAAGSAAMVFAAFVIIAFWQFRHPGVYDVLPAGVARPRGGRRPR